MVDGRWPENRFIFNPRTLIVELLKILGGMIPDISLDPKYKPSNGRLAN